MGKAKLLIVYYSMTGANYKLAKQACAGTTEDGIEVRMVKVEEAVKPPSVNTHDAYRQLVEAEGDIPVASLDDLVWADAILFSTPVRFGAMASQIKHFIDTTGGLWEQGKLDGKVVSAMATSQSTNGGQEAAILSLYASLCHWGAVIVPTGASCKANAKLGGNPYGISLTVDKEGRFVQDTKDIEVAVKAHVRRMACIAEKIKK